MKRAASLFIAYFFLLPLGLASSPLGNKTLCSDRDDRVASFYPSIGRLVKTGSPTACTATLVGRDCIVTAGHCHPVFERVEFNVPRSNANGSMNKSEEMDTYLLDPSFRFVRTPKKNNEFNDYAVLRLMPNRQTGLSAGEAYGHYEIDDEPLCVEENLQIIGFGRTPSNLLLNWVQTEAVGETVKVSNLGITEYRVSTTEGNSGSALFSLASGKVVGIHLRGGCLPTGGANKGILFSYHPELVEQIRNCNLR